MKDFSDFKNALISQFGNYPVWIVHLWSGNKVQYFGPYTYQRAEVRRKELRKEQAEAFSITTYLNLNSQMAEQEFEYFLHEGNEYKEVVN